jgi:hypothetical protein
MGETIRCLLYLRIHDLAYKYTAYVHHQYDNTVRHILEDPSNNIFFVLQIFLKTLEQRWLEVSLDPYLLFSTAHVS